MNSIVLDNDKIAILEQLGVKPKKDLASLLNGIKMQERLDKVLLVLLDGSGSMSDTMENTTKIITAWRVLQSELMPNMAGWAYGILIFHGFRSADWLVYPRQDCKALTTTGPSADGETPMGHALEIAWGWVRQNCKQARFILLSDGCPTDLPKEDILQQAALHPIPIDTVGIGEKSTTMYGGYDPEFLAKLSLVTGGMFVEVKTVKMLTETILKLSPINRPLLGAVVKE